MATKGRTLVAFLLVNQAQQEFRISAILRDSVNV